MITKHKDDAAAYKWIAGHTKQLASAHLHFDLGVPSSVVTLFRFHFELEDMSIAPLDEPGPASPGYLVHGGGGGNG
ncbi:hypothetical protein THAOC_24015 [Thalassiosira oceanica]|uniref:Uncharacterized protein n=1 Tax=Thalassiosira oceanica TaxID=159749 RepID=K0RQX0_THAOC|nr:hypothetical protein THAOC_24015 [Thalassiosira oceanica]|eukprot:EJK56153.1 hypothetical protein THAOC_24015 [Thalassiosira oceanica]